MMSSPTGRAPISCIEKSPKPYFPQPASYASRAVS